MQDTITSLYNRQSYNTSIDTTGIGAAFFLLFIIITLIFYLSFLVKKTYLGRNWESHRCDYIFLSGYLQPDSTIPPNEYTLKNLKYCIKQTVFNETPLIPYMRETFKKLKYLIDYVNKQVGIYETILNKQISTASTKYNAKIHNKINYLKHKQDNLETIYKELDTILRDRTDKITTGVNNLKNIETETKTNNMYLTQNYVNYITSK